MDGHYRFQFNGVKLDPYRILEVYGIHHPAHQHAIKKLLRAGKSIKDLEQDIDEVILTLNRWKEMLNEERENLKSKQKNTLDTGPLAAAYHRGWTQKNKKRGEFYLTILNDLAENIEIKGRLTLPNLCEVLGWMAQEQHLMTQHMCKVHDKMIKIAMESMISQMQEGLFAKSSYPKEMRSVLQSHDEHERSPGVGHKNPVEAAKHSVQRPARPVPRTAAKNKAGQ